MATAVGGIAWSWAGPAVLAKHGSGYPMAAVYAGLLFDAAAGESVDVAVWNESGAAVESRTVALGAGAAGLADRVQRLGPAARGRRLHLVVSGNQDVRMVLREASLGVHTR